MVILVYNALGKMKAQGLKVTDLAANLTTIEQAVLALAPDNFGQYGIEINKISGLTISLPDEVQKAIDTRSQIQVLGVNYMQYQAGQAMVDAAKNPVGDGWHRSGPRRRHRRGRRDGLRLRRPDGAGYGGRDAAAHQVLSELRLSDSSVQYLLSQLRRFASAGTATGPGEGPDLRPVRLAPAGGRKVLPQLWRCGRAAGAGAALRHRQRRAPAAEPA